MTVGELKASILSELRIELKGDPSYSDELVSIKIDNAIREIIKARKYPNTYTAEMIEDDLNEFYSNIKNIALYDYNQIGVEFQTGSTENGESRNYVDRSKLFYGVIPFAR